VGLNDVPDLHFLLFMLGAMTRRAGRSITTLNLSGNGISSLGDPCPLQQYLPDLRTLRLAGHRIEPDELAGFTEVTVLTESDEEDDVDLELEPRGADTAARRLVNAVPSGGSAEIFLFVDEFLTVSARNIGRIDSYYTDDAVLSFVFPAIGRRSKRFFPFNRDLTRPNAKAVPQIHGRPIIRAKLLELFPGGLMMVLREVRVRLVFDLIYEVEIYGTWMDDNVIFGVERALTVIGTQGVLLIKNDCVSFRDLEDLPEEAAPGTGRTARVDD
jgi:hypothetical protein